STPAAATRSSSSGRRHAARTSWRGCSSVPWSCTWSPSATSTIPRRPRRRARDRALPHPPPRAPSLSGPSHRGRGHRWLGQVAPAPPPRALAHLEGLPRALHRVELLAPRAPLDEAREEEGPADADDLQPAPRRRLRGPAHLPDHAAAQG